MKWLVILGDKQTLGVTVLHNLACGLANCLILVNKISQYHLTSKLSSKKKKKLTSLSGLWQVVKFVDRSPVKEAKTEKVMLVIGKLFGLP